MIVSEFVQIGERILHDLRPVMTLKILLKAKIRPPEMPRSSQVFNIFSVFTPKNVKFSMLIPPKFLMTFFSHRPQNRGISLFLPEIYKCLRKKRAKIEKSQGHTRKV